jgi:hypothetical protein
MPKPKEYCLDCGCPVYSLGCTNCNEENYIDEQRRRTNRMLEEQEQERSTNSGETK